MFKILQFRQNTQASLIGASENTDVTYIPQMSNTGNKENVVDSQECINSLFCQNASAEFIGIEVEGRPGPYQLVPNGPPSVICVGFQHTERIFSTCQCKGTYAGRSYPYSLVLES